MSGYLDSHTIHLAVEYETPISNWLVWEFLEDSSPADE